MDRYIIYKYMRPVLEKPRSAQMGGFVESCSVYKYLLKIPA